VKYNAVQQLKANRRFGGTRLHLQIRSIRQANSICGLIISDFLIYSSNLKMGRGYTAETSDDFNGLHGVVSQKMEIFKSKRIHKIENKSDKQLAE
jgi:hypothetical protein